MAKLGAIKRADAVLPAEGADVVHVLRRQPRCADDGDDSMREGGFDVADHGFGDGEVHQSRRLGLFQHAGEVVTHVHLGDQPQIRLGLDGGHDLLPHAPLRAGDGDGDRPPRPQFWGGRKRNGRPSDSPRIGGRGAIFLETHAFFFPFLALPFWNGPTVAIAY